MIVSPLRVTWKRWKRMLTIRYSLLRRLQYERISGLSLEGRTLDVGGGLHCSYYPFLQIKGRIESVNIELQEKPTIIADLRRSLPFSDECFDNIIWTMNSVMVVYCRKKSTVNL